ncbi:MAG: molybdopterin dinucleotide binding domain-containing protein, partial [Desulfobaccales bacterium]|nr:molybdopterin dinucleotide binding domain-containing protein [Desulfobaccales bacterium]
MTRVSPSLHREMEEGYMEICPADAKAMDIKDGERIKVSSRRG